MLTDARLYKSIEQYREILDHAGKLKALLAQGHAEQLSGYVVRLNELQAEAGLNDQPLLAEIVRDSARWQTHPLFLQRMQLLEQIVKMNDLLLPTARGMMAVAAAELQQLKEGRVAVSGYQQRPTQNRNFTRGVG